MVKTEERMQILRMIEEGKISPEEGAKLLSALSNKASDTRPGGDKPARWFHVRVNDLLTGKAKVNVTIPMGLVNVGIKMGARFIPESADIQAKDLLEQIQRGAKGKILEVTDEENGEQVEIFLE